MKLTVSLAAAGLAATIALPALASGHGHHKKPKLTQVTVRETTGDLPSAVADAPRVAHESRMAQARGDVRGIYVRGVTAGRPDFPHLLAGMKRHGLNAIVLDAKDYDGILTYPSKVPLAVETQKQKDPPIKDLHALIKSVKDEGIRVIVRISCFEDELLARAKPAQSVQSKAHRAYPIGWLDPSNAANQRYVQDLAREAMDAGADEIELDYVRYPVNGIHNADFHLAERNLTQKQVITKFVHDTHAITRARGIPLSLDIFGVIAFGKKEDIERLGQDPALLAAECEALSPMVYPSHYTEGFAGFDVPGNHPELVGMATKLMKEQIADVPHAAVLRPWLQAARYESPNYSAGYVAEEVQSAAKAGATGYLMWNPGQRYDLVFTAVGVPSHKAEKTDRADKPEKSDKAKSAPEHGKAKK
jgi:hypothetical protein